MSIASTLKYQAESLDDLAALPQAMIMQMAQKGQIREDLLAPILGRKAEMAEAIARTKALQSQGQQQPTVMEQIMQRNAEAETPAPEPREMGIAQLPVREDMYGAQGMAGGGIVAFAPGGEVDEEELTTEQLIAQLRKDRESIKARAAEDKNDALIAAGLGIMGGTSPFALANIGTGGMKGVEQLTASAKNRAAELESLNKGLSGAVSARDLNKIRKEEAENLAEYRKDQMQARRDALADRVDNKEAQAIQKIESVINRNPIVNDFKKRMELLDPSDPMYTYYYNEIEKVYDNAYGNAGIKTPRVSVKPGTPPVPEEKPGFWSNLFGGKKQASGGTMKFDKEGNPI